jgi:hypothetical protein
MGSGISREATVRASRELVSARLDDGLAILQFDKGVYYGLDPVGARIWELVQEPRTVEAILAAMLDEYDVEPVRCETDLLELLSDLARHGLVEVRDATAA